MFKEIAIAVYLVSNPYMEAHTQKQIVKQAVRQINKETIAKLRLRFKKIPNTCETDCQEPICATYDLFNCYESKLKRRRRMKLVVAPPYVDKKGSRWFLGLSDFCSRKGLSFVTVQETRTNGDPIGRLMSEKDIVHELGHILGADHSSKLNIMNPKVCALAAEGEDLHFTRFQGHIAIKSCLRRLGL